MIESSFLENLSGYIDGHWLNADSSATFSISNPATGQTLAEVPYMGAAETQRAITAADSARREIPTEAVRQRWLRDIAEALRAEKNEIGRILCMEHGKPLHEACDEVEYAASFFDYYADIIINALAPEDLPGQFKGCKWSVYKRPIGVTGLITPWNFPIGMIAKKLAPALAAGCPTIIKPASETPLTMIALFRLMADRLDIPAGMVNLVMGSSSAIGTELMTSPLVPMVSFTGSTEVGQLLLEQSRGQVKKLGLELGGNAPFIVLDDADLDAAADNLIANKFRGGGQTCVCANRVYVQSAVYNAFAEKVVERVRALKVGDGIAAGVDVGPLINAAGFNKVKAHVTDALKNGAKLEQGPQPETMKADGSLFYSPTVLTDVRQDMLCCQEETFGPLVPLVSFETDAEALTLGNQSEFGLAAYVFSADTTRAEHLINHLHYGHCGYNTGTGPAAHTPFGGMLKSGIGYEGGHAGLMEYIELQSVPNGS